MSNNAPGHGRLATYGKRLRTDRRGVAAAEFAMVATVLLLFIVAIVDIGASIQQRMVLQQAARAAGIYAQSFPTQTNDIISAVQAALPSTWSDANVATPLTCSGASSAQLSGCVQACGGGTSGDTYLVVQICKPYKPFLFATGNCNVGTQPGNCVSYVIKLQ